MSGLGELIARGRTSDVHRFGIDGAAKVLLPSTPWHWAQAEATFTETVRQAGAPSPRVRDVIEIDGRPAIVFDRVDGPSMWARMLDRPDDVAALARDLADVQRLIHATSVPDDLPSMADRVRAKIADVGLFTDAERSEAIGLLDELPSGAALLHGDLHPGNVLLGAHGLVVIDWFDASVGHPAGDIARTELLIRATGATDLRHLPGADATVLESLRNHYLSRLDDVIGKVSDLQPWTRLAAAARLAERTDADATGLVDLWRDLGSVPTENFGVQ